MIKLIVAPLPIIEIFLVVACATLYIDARKERRRSLTKGLALLMACTVLLIVLSLAPVANGLAWLLESPYKAPADQDLQRVQTIVILGGGLSREAGIPVIPSTTTHFRVARGVKTFRSSRARRIVMAGGPGSHKQGESVAAVMKSLAVSMGIPEDLILVDSKSQTTREHPIELLKLIGADRRGETLGLVTSAWHMPRAMRTFSRYFDDIVPIPCDYISGRANINPEYVLPGVGPLSNATNAIQEFIGLAWYEIVWRLSPK